MQPPPPPPPDPPLCYSGMLRLHLSRYLHCYHGCCTLLSTIFQLYRGMGISFNGEKNKSTGGGGTTEMPQETDKGIK